jgi:hypothetical protein
VALNKNRFTALHYAFLRGGVLVEVSHDVEAKEPVRIVRSTGRISSSRRRTH